MQSSARQPSSSDDYGLPFFRRAQALASVPVVLGPKDRDRPYRGLSPLRSFNPSASPFTRCRVTPTSRPILDAWSSSEITAFASEPQTRLCPPWPRRTPANSDMRTRPEDPCARREGPRPLRTHAPRPGAATRGIRRATDSADPSTSDPANALASAGLRPLRARSRGHWAAPPLGGDSFPFDLSTLQKSRAWPLGLRSAKPATPSSPRRNGATRTPCLS